MKKSVYLENVEKTIKNQIKWQKLERDEVALRNFLVSIMSFITKLYQESEAREEEQQK